MHKRMGLGHVVDVGSRSHHGVHEARVGIDSDVRLHSKVPLVEYEGTSRFRSTAPECQYWRIGK